MSDLSVTVRVSPDVTETRSAPQGTTAAELFPDRAVVAARVGGELRDLAYVVRDGDVVEPVRIDSEDGRAVLRHSTAHVMAQAVQELFPEAKLGIGPPIENGFYYDFDVETPVHPGRPQGASRSRCSEIVKPGQRFSRRVVTDERGPRGARRRAVQARADRPQGPARPTTARTSRSAAPS